jgi:hypothetical protein
VASVFAIFRPALLASLGMNEAQYYFPDRSQARYPALFPGDAP